MAANIHLHPALKNWRRSFAEMLDATRAEAERAGIHDAEAVAAEMDKTIRAVHDLPDFPKGK